MILVLLCALIEPDREIAFQLNSQFIGILCHGLSATKFVMNNLRVIAMHHMIDPGKSLWNLLQKQKNYHSFHSETSGIGYHC